MRIYVNRNYEILALDTEPASYEHIIEVESTRKEMFGNWCDTCIEGYKYEPQYKMIFNKDGSVSRDINTEEICYELDDSGSKVITGYSCYPFVDHKMLTLIQKQHEDSQRLVQALNAQIEYLSMMSGIETEVNYE